MNSTISTAQRCNGLAYRGCTFTRPPESKSCKFKYILPMRPRPHKLRVVNDHERSQGSPTATTERSEADKLVDKMEFSELCNEFECVSSPSVEATARQLARDILEMREGNRALGTFAVSVKYKDPLRSFTGRNKYKRPSWARGALDQPYVTLQEMTMLSTSVLNIKWTIRGKSKISIIFSEDVILSINSLFTLNQISGQVIEHQEDWDLSASSALGQAYFWASRYLYVATEAGKDVAEVAKDFKSPFDKEEEDSNIFADPSGDPTKFFQVDNNPQRDAYQVGLFLAVVYLVVQFLKSTLYVQFEWAWQHPKELAKGMDLGGTAGKIRLAYTMLTLSEWRSLNLTVNFLSTKYMSNTRGCPILPSHMKVQICPVDELPCYTNDWMSDCEDDLEDECYVRKSVASDLEEEMEVDKGATLMKQHTKIKKQKKQECVQNPAKKCRRSGCSLKQFKCNSDELSAKAKVPSPSKSSLFSAQTGAESEELDSLNRFFSTSDCQIQISNSENSEDSNGTSDSFVIPNTTSLPVNLSQEASTTVKNNWSINFRADYSLPNVSKSGKLKDISEEYSIKHKMIAASDSEEYNLSDELKIDSENSEDSNGTSDSSIMPKTTTSLPVNLSQEASTTVKNNWSINFRADYSLLNVSESGKLKDISEEYNIKRKMIAASDSEEYNLSDELKIYYRLTKDSEVDKIVNDIDDFSIKSKAASSNMIEFPSLQEYSPVCYILPLKMSEEASLSFTSPFKSPPTKKPISVSCTFLSPVASQRQVITLLSTPRPVSKNVIDLTDSPAT